MKILVTEVEPDDGRTVGALLAVRGHDVDFCHPPGSTGWPCAGLAPGGCCPLTDGGADVVVDVRIAGGPPSAREMGAACAVAAGTPLIIAGRAPEGTALAERATLVCAPDAVESACAGMSDVRLATRDEGPRQESPRAP